MIRGSRLGRLVRPARRRLARRRQPSQIASVRRAGRRRRPPRRTALEGAIAGRWRSCSIDGMARRSDTARWYAIRSLKNSRAMPADTRAYRPLERFWPYADLLSSRPRKS